MYIANWNIEEMTGYKPMTTFYTDFSIADNFGIKAVKGTFKDVESCLDCMSYKYITELTMVLNWKIWEHYKKNEELARTYDTMWRKMCSWVEKNFEEYQLKYYYMITD